MNTVAVIPARLGSSRLPGKPLCDLRGLPMIEHVYRRVELSDAVEATYVATPDEELQDAVKSFGGEAILTGEHTRGTDRAAEAAQEFDADVVVIVHTDEPLITPEMVDEAVEPVFAGDNDVQAVNVARPIQDEAAFRNPNNVKVVSDLSGDALYFSRSPVPYHHHVNFGDVRLDHQVCVVPMERELLLEYPQLKQGPLERAEAIDMLRLLEHGYDIRVVRTERQTRSVDTPEEREEVSELLATDELFTEYAPQEG